MKMLNTKRLLLGVVTVGAACALPTFVQAAGMKYICSHCHTMHFSQNGATLAHDTNGETGTLIGGPNDNLLNKNCAGCHTGSANPAADGTPQVGPEASGSFLAGGYFTAASNAANSRLTHNAYGITGMAKDVNIDTASVLPPGYDTAENGTWAGVNGASKMVGCSGSSFTVGCHREGGHHNNSGGALTLATTAGNSFRFLMGVKGREDTDRELTKGAGDHNQYFAILRPKGSADVENMAAIQTVNGLCAKCHGNFHGGYNATAPVDGQDGGSAGSSWIRHPTDIDLMASAAEHASYATYDTTVPVGTTVAAITLVNATVQTAGNGVVLCISCHRAHGSDQPDLLRWDYAGMVAGSTAVPGTGCFKCHRAKD